MMQVMGKNLYFYYLGIRGNKELVQVPALNEREARMEFVKNTVIPFDSDEIMIYTEEQIPKSLRTKLRITLQQIKKESKQDS